MTAGSLIIPAPRSCHSRRIAANCLRAAGRSSSAAARRRFVGQLPQPRAPALDVLPLGVALLAGARGAFEAPHQLVVRPAIVERGHAFPFGGRDLELVERLLALQPFDALAQIDARARRRVPRLARQPLGLGAIGVLARPFLLAVRFRCAVRAASAASGSTTGGGGGRSCRGASRASCSSAARRSSISRTIARARFDALLFFARAAICSSSPRSVIRSTAASVGSLNSLLSATLRSSA